MVAPVTGARSGLSFDADDRSFGTYIRVLGAMPKIVVHQCQRQHCFGDRRGPQSDTGIMAPGGDDPGGAAGTVHRYFRPPGCSTWASTRCSPGYPVRKKCPPRVPPDEFLVNPSGVSSSRWVLPRCRTHSNPSPNSTPLTALMLIMPWGDRRFELVEDGFAQSGRRPGGDHVDPRPDGVARCAQIVHETFQLFKPAGVGAEERIVVDGVKVAAVQPQWPELPQVSINPHTQSFMEIFAGDSPRRARA